MNKLYIFLLQLFCDHELIHKIHKFEHGLECMKCLKFFPSCLPTYKFTWTKWKNSANCRLVKES